MDAQPVQQFGAVARSREIQARSRQAGSRQVHVGIDESGTDEASLEVDDLGFRVERPPDVVIAHPDDRAVGDGHRRRVGVGRRVDTATKEQLRRHGDSLPCRRRDSVCGRQLALLRGHGYRDVDDLSVDHVAAEEHRPRTDHRNHRGQPSCPERGHDRASSCTHRRRHEQHTERRGHDARKDHKHRRRSEERRVGKECRL